MAEFGALLKANGFSLEPGSPYDGYYIIASLKFIYNIQHPGAYDHSLQKAFDETFDSAKSSLVKKRIGFTITF